MGLYIVDAFANTAGTANAKGGMISIDPNAAHIAIIAYGLHAVKKPMHTAMLSWKKKRRHCIS